MNREENGSEWTLSLSYSNRQVNLEKTYRLATHFSESVILDSVPKDSNQEACEIAESHPALRRTIVVFTHNKGPTMFKAVNITFKALETNIQ